MDDIEIRRDHDRRKARQEQIASGKWWASTNSFELISSTGASPKQCIFAAALVVAMFVIGGLFPN